MPAEKKEPEKKEPGNQGPENKDPENKNPENKDAAKTQKIEKTEKAQKTAKKDTETLGKPEAEPADTDRAGSRRKLELSPTQVAGSALGSVTAAYVGSYLGVAGTVVGAALTSVTMTVGGTLYQRSLEKTKNKAQELAKVELARVTRIARSQAGPEREKTLRIRPPASETCLPGMQWPGGEWVLDEPAAGEPAPGEPTVALAQPVGRGRVRWPVVAAASALAFVLCMLLITGWEGITGRSLSGGGHQTTVGGVFGQPPAQHPAAQVPAMPRTSSTRPTPSVPPSQPAVPAPSSTSSVPSTSVAPTNQTQPSVTSDTPTSSSTSSQSPQSTGGTSVSLIP